MSAPADDLFSIHNRASGRWVVYPDGLRQLVRDGVLSTVQDLGARAAQAGGGHGKSVLVQRFTDLHKPLYHRRRLFRTWREDQREAMLWAAGGDVGEVALEELEDLEVGHGT